MRTVCGQCKKPNGQGWPKDTTLCACEPVRCTHPEGHTYEARHEQQLEFVVGGGANGSSYVPKSIYVGERCVRCGHVLGRGGM